MAFGDNTPGLLDRLLFEQATEKQKSLSNRLSHTVVRDLADEVINRISIRFAGRTEMDVQVPPEELEAFCNALARGDDQTCLDMVNSVVANGSSVERVYLAYLGSAARMLGTWWEEDKATFSEVTIGAGRIYAMLCALRPTMIETVQPNAQHAAFVTVPGEQHFLGATMAADMFRARGWEIDLYTGRTHEELIEALDRTDPAFIGLSASSNRAVMPLVRLVVALRIGHPGSFIVVSGHIVDDDLDISDVTGADLFTSDLDVAFAEMQRLASEVKSFA